MHMVKARYIDTAAQIVMPSMHTVHIAYTLHTHFHLIHLCICENGQDFARVCVCVYVSWLKWYVLGSRWMHCVECSFGLSMHFGWAFVVNKRFRQWIAGEKRRHEQTRIVWSTWHSYSNAKVSLYTAADIWLIYKCGASRAHSACQPTNQPTIHPFVHILQLFVCHKKFRFSLWRTCKHSSVSHSFGGNMNIAKWI